MRKRRRLWDCFEDYFYLLCKYNRWQFIKRINRCSYQSFSRHKFYKNKHGQAKDLCWYHFLSQRNVELALHRPRYSLAIRTAPDLADSSPWHIWTRNHTWYLSIFLHRQNFWKIKFTPKFTQKIAHLHRKLPIYTVNCQFTQ